MKIGQVARHVGLATSAIRYYERIGLLPLAERVSGRRQYTEQAINHLAVIVYAQACGFRLDEIKTLFASGGGRRREGLWMPLAKAKVDELLDREARLRGMRKLLEGALTCRCLGLDDCGALLRRQLEQRKAVVSGKAGRRPGARSR